MKTEQVPNEGSCRVKCYLEPNCVSINVGPGTEGQHTCDLNNRTDESPSHSSLEKREHYIHYAVENFCHGDPCPGDVSVCQVGFTTKGYRCACRAGYTARGDHGQCEDINECQSRLNSCKPDYECTNTIGSFICKCPSGFVEEYNDCRAPTTASTPTTKPIPSTSTAPITSSTPTTMSKPTTSTIYPKNCDKVYQSSNEISGVYKIDPDGLGEFEVFCDQTTAGGGWTVFQKRFDGSVDFYRGWDDYKRGFGNLTGEFWLGLDKIHRLTVSSNNMLRVDLEDVQGRTLYAEYSSFAVGNETEKYKLSVKWFSGTAGNALAYHRGSPFTTKDSDNDGWSSGNCALSKKGGWWYNHCYRSNLNGQYMPGAMDKGPGMNWYYWRNSWYSVKRTEMKIRPKEF